MSTTAPPPASSTPVTSTAQEITVISHSQLFYWWPVWAVGFIMALVTFLEKDVLAVVPKGTKAVKEATVIQPDGTRLKGEVYVLPEGGKVMREDRNDPTSQTRPKDLHER